MVTKSPESSRDAILRAAAEALLASGAGGLRVDSVAAAAGFNKRMIYHYFGDKQGLLRAVYVQQAQRLMASDAMNTATRRIVALLLGDLAGAGDEQAAQSSPGELAAALAILLPVMMRGAPHGDTRQLTREQWRTFALDIVSLCFPAVATAIFAAAPGSAEFKQVSEHALPAGKPRYRISSTARRR